MYNIVKIQWQIVYIKCTKSSYSLKKSNLLNVRNHQYSMENWVHRIDK